jgi:glucose uptake protein GlcU
MITLFFIVAAALSQVVCSNILRAIQARSHRIEPVILANYLVTAAIGLVYCLGCCRPQFSGQILRLGGITGIFYMLSLIPILHSMGQRGLAMTMAVSNLAQLVPCLVGIIYFKESPTVLQKMGMVIAGGAVPLMSLATVTGTAIRERPSLRLILLLFIFQGSAMSGNLVAFKSLPAAAIPSYLAVLFGTAFVTSVILCIVTRPPVRGADLKAGTFFGFFNFTSTFVIVTALSYVGGCILFAAMSVLGLVVAAALGAWWWKERVQIWGWAGLALAAAALALLNMR